MRPIIWPTEREVATPLSSRCMPQPRRELPTDIAAETIAGLRPGVLKCLAR